MRVIFYCQRVFIFPPAPHDMIHKTQPDSEPQKVPVEVSEIKEVICRLCLLKIHNVCGILRDTLFFHFSRSKLDLKRIKNSSYIYPG